MKQVILSFCLMIMAAGSVAQVSINSDHSLPHPSAGLEVKSTSMGFLPPVMSRMAMYAINDPAEGLMVYCSDCRSDGGGVLCVFMAGRWSALNSGCIIPATPVAASTIPGTLTTFRWHRSQGAIGYRAGFTAQFDQSFDVGADTSFSTALDCDSSYRVYVWAYVGCGHSGAARIDHVTSPCPHVCGGFFRDRRDGRQYETVSIAGQCWMKQNLNTGTLVSGNQTNNGELEKHCYGDQNSNCNVYGGLYQWGEAVQYLNGASNSTSWNPVPTGDVRGICPEGWHLPSQNEWSELTVALGGVYVAGGKLKETGTVHWASPNTGASDSTGFTALPGGQRMETGTFANLTFQAFFLTATEFSATDHYLNRLSYDNPYVNGATGPKNRSKSVRCVYDD